MRKLFVSFGLIAGLIAVALLWRTRDDASGESGVRPAIRPETTAAPAGAPLWGPATTTGQDLTGDALAQARASGAPTTVRTSTIPLDSLARLAELQQGSEVTLPLPGGTSVTGRVNLVLNEDGGTIRIGGSLTGPRRGSFSLHLVNGALNGRVLVPDEQVGYIISTPATGAATRALELQINEIVCYPMPRNPAAAFRPAGVVSDGETDGGTPSRLADTVPFSSRPGATHVLYLDFDGESVVDPDWNNGLPIHAQPSRFNVEAIWELVSGDFLPFASTSPPIAIDTMRPPRGSGCG